MLLRSFRISALTLALACAAGAAGSARPHATPTPAPTPTPVADPAITKLVRQQFVAWQAGAINKTLYAPEVLSKLDDAKVTDVSQKLASLGALVDMTYIGPLVVPNMPADAHGYVYQMHCREGNVYVWIILDGAGRIATIFFKDRLDTETVEVPASPTPP